MAAHNDMMPQGWPFPYPFDEHVRDGSPLSKDDLAAIDVAWRRRADEVGLEIEDGLVEARFIWFEGGTRRVCREKLFCAAPADDIDGMCRSAAALMTAIAARHGPGRVRLSAIPSPLVRKSGDSDHGPSIRVGDDGVPYALMGVYYFHENMPKE